MSKSELSPIEQQVRGHLKRAFPGGDPFLILGVSGGPDSMALLYMFKRLGIRVLVVHINYLTRGEASDRDQELVEQLAHVWGFDCHSFRIDHREAEGQNFQQWARDFRYRVFEDLRIENDADAVVTAHHRDDQLETILQKLLRGAGLASWKGMKVRQDHLFRPMVDVSRSQVMDYIEQHQVPYRTDASNLETDYARNFLRHEWIPEMNKHFPGWQANLLRLIEQAEVFHQAVELIREEELKGDRGLSRALLLRCAPELRQALVLDEIRRMDPDLSVSRAALEQLNRLDELQTGRSILLTKEIELLRDRDQMVLQRLDEPHLEYVHRLLFRERLEHEALCMFGLEFSLGNFKNPDFDTTLYLNAEALSWPLTIRRWKRGDRFRPFGMEGHQKVSDHLTNRKIPSNLKGEALVIETFEETICAVIFPPFENGGAPGSISETVRCPDDTRTCLKISYC